MANFNLDRIRFKWRSTWVANTVYTKDDIVYYNGKAYVCLIGHTANSSNLTTDLLNVAAKWELMFDGCVWRGNWTNTTYYTVGDIVKFDGYVYQCVTSHTSTNLINTQLPADIARWTIVATTYNWLNVWTTAFYYDLGDVVRYNGITYICSTKHTSAATPLLGLEANIASWTIVTTSDSWQKNWVSSTRYKVKDIVKYGGIVYRCIEAHSAASIALGLEADILKWEIVNSGIEYKSDWMPETRYKLNDIVKWGHSLWIALAGHTSSTTNLRVDQSNWAVWLPGLGYESIWINSIEYQKGDIVIHGGYSYTALTNNINSIPSVNGIVQDTGAWELLTSGYNHRGEWTSITAYQTGDVIRNDGYLYVAVNDNTTSHPDTGTDWELLVPGSNWHAEWIDNIEYSLGDIVTYAGVAYVCVLRHLGTASDNRPDLDIQNTNNNYWTVLIQGTASNVLTTQGDIRTRDPVATARLAIGNAGAVFSSTGVLTEWKTFQQIDNVYYVSVEGIDDPFSGVSTNSPFRTIRYAMQFIQSDLANRAPATVLVKTGIYEEILPISIPVGVALVGDELRSTVIMPAAGHEDSNMFYMRNGSGLRNCTLQGLAGTLPAAQSAYGTRTPTGGAFVSLDPGTGPTDTSVHITNKSPYVQNVTAFGTACIGMKIDGTLHASGNKSIVANDFTQIISDGIGYWANEAGRSELVSVFTYYCYIGYYSTSGGILRATNGNNSYGTFGSRAEGYSLFESPITAKVDNRTSEAQVEVVHTTGSELLAFGYSHAGQTYTSASASVSGTGINANVTYDEFRNNAVSQLRVIDPSDSSTPGGLNYQYLLNSAQGGDEFNITLAASDTDGTATKYVGMRIVIVSGKGIGQYAQITGYNQLTKNAVVSKEYTGTAGWENLYPGRPIESVLDSTTRYSLEPRVLIDSPTVVISTNSAVVWPAGFTSTNVLTLAHLDGTWIAINGQGDAAKSTDGAATFVSSSSNLAGNATPVGNLNRYSTIANNIMFLSSATSKVFKYIPITDSWFTITLGLSSNNNYTDIASNPTTGISVALTKTGWNRFGANGGTQSNGTFTASGASNDWNSITYGNGKFVAIRESGHTAYSTDDGATWTENTSTPITTGGQASLWSHVQYGNGRFVAAGSKSGTNTTTAAYSFDSVTWYVNDDYGFPTVVFNGAGLVNSLIYTNGEFLLTAGNSASSTLLKTKDGWAWQAWGEDSAAYNLNNTSAINAVGYDDTNVKYTQTGSTIVNLLTGAGAVIRAIVGSSRIQSFNIYDPGANYRSIPGVLVVDPESTIDVLDSPRLASGVLTQPAFVNRGIGYVTATALIIGNGFADIFQSDKTIKLKNLSAIPGVGANIVFNSIDNVIYRLTKVVSQAGTGPNYDVTFNISPPLTNQNSPAHEEDIIIRELYSQIRLTGHDFLDIGVGNFESTRYPELYVEGYNPTQVPEPFNEVTQYGGGRVFYTSTDQDGNFRVGELFAVEQNTGIVSINADFFELSGLQELSLGAIQVGGTAVIIREFSKEPTFIANSNNIVPTQAAIVKYLTSRISGGGADAVTNTLFAGQVKLTGNSISTSSGLQINIPVQVNMTKGVDGDYLAQLFFASKK